MGVLIFPSEHPEQRWSDSMEGLSCRRRYCRVVAGAADFWAPCRLIVDHTYLLHQILSSILRIQPVSALLEHAVFVLTTLLQSRADFRQYAVVS